MSFNIVTQDLLTLWSFLLWYSAIQAWDGVGDKESKVIEFIGLGKQEKESYWACVTMSEIVTIYYPLHK